MLISKMKEKDFHKLKKIYSVIPVLNNEKTRIDHFESISFDRKDVEKIYIQFKERPNVFSLDHWFETENEINIYIYRREQHLYKFNDDILNYLSLRFNLKLEVVAVNLEELKQLAGI